MNFKNLLQKTKPNKMNATTRRATMPLAEDYDTDEPNVRLSRAFLVVMLLHVVAVGGIFAFSSLKKNPPATLEVPDSIATSRMNMTPTDSRTYIVTTTDTLGSIASTFGLTRNDLETANHLSESYTLRAGDKLIIPAKSTVQPVPLNVQKLLQLSQIPKVETAIPAKPNTVLTTSSKTVKVAEPIIPTNSADSKIYVVQKGDNPALIAKRQGIKYADLLEANKITDPKKLQIGQKLIIPQK